MGLYVTDLQGAAPSTPAAGDSVLYPLNADGKWYYKKADASVKTLVTLEDAQTFTGVLTLTSPVINTSIVTDASFTLAANASTALNIGHASGTITIPSQVNINGGGVAEGGIYLSQVNTIQSIHTLDDNTGTGSFYLQAGNGASTHGGQIRMFGASHASYPGDVIASLAAVGNFRINTLSNGSGTNLLKVTNAGAVTIPGTLGVTGTTTLGGVNASGLHTSTKTANFFTNVSGGAGSLYARLTSTNGDLIWGVNGDTPDLFTSATANSAVFGSVAAKSLHLATSNAVRFTIDSAGAVTIPSTLAAGATTITGTISTTGLATITDTGNTNNFKFASFVTNSAEAGNVIRVGTTSAVVYTTTSDHRTKDTFGPFKTAINDLRALTVYDGQYKTDTIHRPMLIAHEVAEITPGNVFGEKDEIEVIDVFEDRDIKITFDDGFEGFVKAKKKTGTETKPVMQKMAVGGQEALLIAGWQANDERIIAMQAQIAALTSRVVALNG